MNIQIIDTGYFYADGGAMFGAVPKTAWSRRYPSNELNGCILAMRSMLLSNVSEKIILIDNGAGTKQLKQLSYYNFFDMVDLGDELRKRDIAPEQVTDVVLTHLHFDHCGYSTLKNEKTGEIAPAFPNATHWVSRRQWENFLHPNALEKDSYFIENMKAIEDSGLLRLIDTDTALCPDVDLRLFDGHTPGQIVPYIRTREQTFVFAGDVIPLAASVSPEWISAYDTFPVTSYQEKVRLLEEAAREGQIIIYCHDAYTVYSKVKKTGCFFTKEKIEALYIYHQRNRGFQ